MLDYFFNLPSVQIEMQGTRLGSSDPKGCFSK